MVKEHKSVCVTTLPNGYSLVFNGQSYMYFNLCDLLEGFMYHVGLEELANTDNETIQEFVAASIVWRADNGNTTKEIMKLKRENESLRRMCGNYQKKIKLLNQKLVSNGNGGGSHSATDDDDDDELDDDE